MTYYADKLLYLGPTRVSVRAMIVHETRGGYCLSVTGLIRNKTGIMLLTLRDPSAEVLKGVATAWVLDSEQVVKEFCELEDHDGE